MLQTVSEVEGSGEQKTQPGRTSKRKESFRRRKTITLRTLDKEFASRRLSDARDSINRGTSEGTGPVIQTIPERRKTVSRRGSLGERGSIGCEASDGSRRTSDGRGSISHKTTGKLSVSAASDSKNINRGTSEEKESVSRRKSLDSGAISNRKTENKESINRRKSEGKATINRTKSEDKVSINRRKSDGKELFSHRTSESARRRPTESKISGSNGNSEGRKSISHGTSDKDKDKEAKSCIKSEDKKSITRRKSEGQETINRKASEGKEYISPRTSEDNEPRSRIKSEDKNRRNRIKPKDRESISWRKLQTTKSISPRTSGDKEYFSPRTSGDKESIGRIRSEGKETISRRTSEVRGPIAPMIVIANSSLHKEDSDSQQPLCASLTSLRASEQALRELGKSFDKIESANSHSKGIVTRSLFYPNAMDEVSIRLSLRIRQEVDRLQRLSEEKERKKHGTPAPPSPRPPIPSILLADARQTDDKMDEIENVKAPIIAWENEEVKALLEERSDAAVTPDQEAEDVPPPTDRKLLRRRRRTRRKTGAFLYGYSEANVELTKDYDDDDSDENEADEKVAPPLTKSTPKVPMTKSTPKVPKRPKLKKWRPKSAPEIKQPVRRGSARSPGDPVSPLSTPRMPSARSLPSMKSINSSITAMERRCRELAKTCHDVAWNIRLHKEEIRLLKLGYMKADRTGLDCPVEIIYLNDKITYFEDKISTFKKQHFLAKKELKTLQKELKRLQNTKRILPRPKSAIDRAAEWLVEKNKHLSAKYKEAQVAIWTYKEEMRRLDQGLQDNDRMGVRYPSDHVTLSRKKHFLQTQIHNVTLQKHQWEKSRIAVERDLTELLKKMGKKSHIRLRSGSLSASARSCLSSHNNLYSRSTTKQLANSWCIFPSHQKLLAPV